MAFKIAKSAQQLPGGEELSLVITSASADAQPDAGASASTRKPLNIITSKSGLVAYVILGKGTYNLIFGGTTSGTTAGNLAQRSKANLVQTLSQWGANLKNGLGGLPKCYVEAELLLAALIKHAGFNVAVYGHSLGGGMATYAAANLSTGNCKIAATGYCSAELGKAAVNAINDNRDEQSVATAITEIQHILIAGDPVSSVGKVVPNLQHVGQVSKIDHLPGMSNPVKIHDQFISSVSFHFS
ncbi:alpha/beta hydrolase [Endozoicomonas lisbonensis]